LRTRGLAGSWGRGEGGTWIAERREEDMVGEALREERAKR